MPLGEHLAEMGVCLTPANLSASAQPLDTKHLLQHSIASEKSRTTTESIGPFCSLHLLSSGAAHLQRGLRNVVVAF